MKGSALRILSGRKLWLSLAVAFAGGFLGFYLYAYMAMAVHLRDQQAILKLPAHIRANAAATHTFDIQMNGNISTQVPVKQRLAVPLQGEYPASIRLKTQIPLAFKLHYKDSIHIKTWVDISGTTDLVLPQAFLPKFPLSARIPLELDVPVDLQIPVNTSMLLDYNGPVRFSLNQTIHTPINTVLNTRLPIDREVSVPLLSSFDVDVYPADKAVPLIVTDSQVQFAVSQLIPQRLKP